MSGDPGRHLHIYTIKYDTDDPSVGPLVYATNLSCNGTLWNGSLIGGGQSILLMSLPVISLTKLTKPILLAEHHTDTPRN